MTTKTQRPEIEAWLGDDHGLTADQVASLARVADSINARYPDPDDGEEREAALIAAYRIMSDPEPEHVLDGLAAELTRSRAAESAALAGIRQAALMLIPDKRISQAGFARAVGVDRMAVRDWLGLRD